MFRRFLFLSVGALALLVVLEAPGQLHAQRVRGGSPNGMRVSHRIACWREMCFDEV
jgi:hypothetical protein